MNTDNPSTDSSIKKLSGKEYDSIITPLLKKEYHD